MTDTHSDEGYIDYFAILGLDADAKPGEVRKEYRRRMKDLVYEIAETEITEEKRSFYLLEMAKLNAAYYILGNSSRREAYATERIALMALERQWRAAAEGNAPDADALRREFDRRIRAFLSKYIEEAMLDAGRDKECVEASHWNEAHERHAFRILRHYRQSLYQKILARLPYVEVTPPRIDWRERQQTVGAILSETLKHG